MLGRISVFLLILYLVLITRLFYEGYQDFSLILYQMLIPSGILGFVNSFILYLIMTLRVILRRIFGFLLVLYLILIPTE